MKKIWLKVLFFCLAISLFAKSAMAAGLDILGTSTQQLRAHYFCDPSPIDYLNSVINVVMVFLMTIFILYIVVGLIKLINANRKKMNDKVIVSKRKIKKGVIGLILVVVIMQSLIFFVNWYQNKNDLPASPDCVMNL